MPARTTTLLVVPASVPASLPPAHAHAYSALPDANANAANKTHSDANADKRNAHPAELDAHASNVHRESGWGSADADAYFNRSSSGGLCDAVSDSAAGGPRHGDSPGAWTRQAEADSCWNVAACPTDADPRVDFKRQEDSDQDENTRESYADLIAHHE